MTSNRTSTFFKIRSVLRPTVESQSPQTSGVSQTREGCESPGPEPPQSTSSNPTPTTLAPTFHIDWDAYGIQFRRALKRKNRATAASWSIPLHSLVAPRTISWNHVVIAGSRNIGNLLMGFVPKVMEDRWFVYAEDVELDESGDTEIGLDSGHAAGLGDDDVGQVATSINDAQPTPQDTIRSTRGVPSGLAVGPSPQRREGVRLHLHRSWTGNEILRMDFRVVLATSDASSLRPFDMFRDDRRKVELHGVRLSYETDGGVMNRPYTDDSAKEAIKGLYLGLLATEVKA